VDAIGTYSFLPYLRRGIAASAANAAAGELRARVGIDLRVSGDAVAGGVITQDIHRDVQLYGPSDIVGIDARAIVRTEPRNWITNFEPNYLAQVEFYDEDFAWRYTPAAPDGQQRLTPWLSLIVLAEGEFAEAEGAAPGATTPFVTVADLGSFPPSADLWAWAHVHVDQSLSAAGEITSDDAAGVIGRFDTVIAANRDHGSARIVSPRRLQPNTAYHCFVMPTFESGRLAGLGLDPTQSPSATAVAWDAYPGRAAGDRFCYYHRWYFRTGIVGDFEYLVRLLEARVLDPHVGQRDMDVLRPGSDLPAISDPALAGVLRLGGALKIPDTNLDAAQLAAAATYENWDEPVPHPFQTALAALVNLADDYANGDASDPDPIIVPPLYGRWHALTDRLLETPPTPPTTLDNWVHELNLDTRWRVPAGFGTAIVQDNQEQYMDIAWKQVGAVLEANRRIRLAHLSRQVAGRLHARHLSAQSRVDPARLLALAAPVHQRLMTDGETVAHRLGGSVVTSAPLSTVMRRITRPAGRLARHLGLSSGASRIGPERRKLPQLATRIAAGQVTAAWPKTAPRGIATTTQLRDKLADRLGDPDTAVLLDEAGRGRKMIDKLPPFPEFKLRDVRRDQSKLEPGRTDSVDATNYKTAMVDLGEVLNVSTKIGVEPAHRAIDLTIVATTAIADLHPDLTIPRRALAGLDIPIRLRPLVVEQFKEAMAYPEIDIPMYEPLVAKSGELFLPNLNLIPPDTISLLETNQRFIESYMVGLNHEMARELLWREYPTDQRGSYFRQFWDPSSQLSLPGETPAQRRERLRDIPPLHLWSRASRLGSHDNRELIPGSSEEEVVLVIRGELLKRYPTAVIYAQRAEWIRKPDGTIDPDSERTLVDLTAVELAAPPPTKLKTPLYEAKIDPDIYFFGFDLTSVEARGESGDNQDDDPGWFFVIRERPGEPRFGFDIERDGDLNVWNDLAWPDVAAANDQFIPVGAASPSHAVLEPTSPAVTEKHEQWEDDRHLHWGGDLQSSEVAYVMYQTPVLVAVHAQEMLGNG